MEFNNNDSIDNFTGGNESLNNNPNQNQNPNPNPNFNEIKQEPSLGKNAPKIEDIKSKPNIEKNIKNNNNIIYLISFVIALIALALGAFSMLKILDHNKKLDKLNASINGIKTENTNMLNEINNKMDGFDKLKKELEKAKKEQKNEIDKTKFVKTAENVLNDIGREYKKDSSKFMNDKGTLDQTKFEDTFLKNEEILKMNRFGKWKVETEGATIRYIYTFNDPKEKENNFYADLNLKAEGDFEVKAIKGTLKTEKPFDITDKMSGEKDDK